MALFSLASCTKPQQGTYINIFKGEEFLNVDAAEHIEEYIVYSDYSRWKFVVTTGDGGSWVSVYPHDCEKDCKFKVKVFENTTGEEREAKIDFILLSGGNPIKTITIRQAR